MLNISIKSAVIAGMLVDSLKENNEGLVLDIADILGTLNDSEDIEDMEDEEQDETEIENLSLERDTATISDNDVTYIGNPYENLVTKYFTNEDGERVSSDIRAPRGLHVSNFGASVASSDFEDAIAISSNKYVFTYLPSCDAFEPKVKQAIKVPKHVKSVNLALSGDGLALAVGFISNKNTKTKVRVYKRKELGSSLKLTDTISAKDIDIDMPLFGKCISLNYDGSILAVGAPHSVNMDNKTIGAIAFYEIDEDDKYKKCESFLHSYTYNFGDKFSLSKNGDLLVNLMKIDDGYKIVVLEHKEEHDEESWDAIETKPHIEDAQYGFKTIVNTDTHGDIALAGSAIFVDE